MQGTIDKVTQRLKDMGFTIVRPVKEYFHIMYDYDAYYCVTVETPILEEDASQFRPFCVAFASYDIDADDCVQKMHTLIGLSHQAMKEIDQYVNNTLDVRSLKEKWIKFHIKKRKDELDILDDKIEFMKTIRPQKRQRSDEYYGEPMLF